MENRLEASTNDPEDCLETLVRKRSHMCTAELAPNTRRKISNVRYFTCKNNVQVRKLSRTLDLESISSDMDSLDFSNFYRKTQWKKSRLQTKIDSAASDMNYLKTTVDIMERKSLGVGRTDALQDHFRRNGEKVHWCQRNLLFTKMRPRV
eukprot:NODE_42_length_29671_cov_0.584810.p15 type:complete len:150 gc:universal NODE_42_length_29671_cov_0.584810:23291-23740(+)